MLEAGCVPDEENLPHASYMKINMPCSAAVKVVRTADRLVSVWLVVITDQENKNEFEFSQSCFTCRRCFAAGAYPVTAPPLTPLSTLARQAARVLPEESTAPGRSQDIPFRLVKMAPLTTLPSGTARRRPTLARWEEVTATPLASTVRDRLSATPNSLTTARSAQPCGTALREPD